MGSWMDPEKGQQQKVVEGIPASYYGTFPQGQPSAGVYPPPPQGGGYEQQQEEQPLQQHQQEPRMSYAASTYPAVPQSQGGFSSYRPWGGGGGWGSQGGGGAWGGGGGGAWGGAWGGGGQQQQYPYQYGQQGGQLPFCNLGYGWLLFLLGFFLVIPWYIGAIMLCCVRGDPRERAGYVACCVASLILLLFSGSGMGYHQHHHHRW